MGRAPCCDKANVKKGPWSPEEDAKLKSYIELHGTGGNWIALPQKIGLKRCGKSCRLRWLNYLRPNIKHGGFSEEEDNIICSLYISIGSRWSIIASQLPGRTDNDIKNYWNTRLKKKLLGKQRKDHHQKHQRRGRGGPKQEAKSDESGNIGLVGQAGSRSTYWTTEPAAAGPMYPTSCQPDHHVDELEHASIIRRLRLTKPAGEKISSGNSSSHLMSPFVPPSSSVTLRQIYDDLASTMTPLENSTTTAASFCEGLQGADGFAAQLDELLRCDPILKLEGIDSCFYGAGGMVDQDHNGTAMSAERMNWIESSPFGYPNVFPSYQLGMPQCMFEEPLHLGML